jgi:glycosyltransferase involved in cell wall biosynthesis
VVCFASAPEVAEVAEVIEIPRRSYENSRLWRIAAPLQYRQCTRDLLEAAPPPADLIVGGEHLFLKAHNRAFPGTPWIYLPHSLTADQEIQSYDLPWLMEKAQAFTYVRLQRWALGHANRTLRFTHYACEVLRKKYPKATARFFVNPMGIDVPPDTERPVRGGQVQLLSVGRLVPGKRIDLALKTLSGIRSLEWHFHVVGDGLERAALERQAQALGIADRVTFHGFQPDPSKWYREADLLVFPSWLENFPITMMESMSYRVPCLAMRGDGVRFHNANAEIMQDGSDGFLATSDYDFATKLENLITEPERLRAAGRAARKTVEEKYTWDRHLDRYEELFSELLR